MRLTRLMLAFAAAALAPACATALWYLCGQLATHDAGDSSIWVRTSDFAFLSLIVSMVAVMALGTPAYLTLRDRSTLRWWEAWLAGFSLAAIPFGLLTLPGLTPNPGELMEVEGVRMVVDGVPTLAGWLGYLKSVAFFGACGTLSAAAFWAVSGMGRRKPSRTVASGA